MRHDGGINLELNSRISLARRGPVTFEINSTGVVFIKLFQSKYRREISYLLLCDYNNLVFFTLF